MFYDDDMQNIFQYYNKNVSHTDHQRSKNFLAINENAESYKTSPIDESSKIFFNQKRIKTFILKYLMQYKIDLLVTDNKNQLFD